MIAEMLFALSLLAFVCAVEEHCDLRWRRRGRDTDGEFRAMQD